MVFLKNLAVSLFGFLLFLSLTIFGLGFTVRSTILNPDFVAKEVDKLPLTSLVEDFVQVQPTPEIPDLNEIIYKAFSDIEPELKKQTGIAIHSVYAYLLGNRPEPDLKSTLKQTYLSAEFVTPLVNSIPVTALLGDAIVQQFADSIPVQIPELDTYIKDILVDIEPSIKQEVIAISQPVFDYLLGDKATLNASLSLQKIRDGLKTKVSQVFVDSPPPDLVFMGISVASLPRDQRAAYFDQYYDTYAKDIPTTFVIDQRFIPPEMRTSLAEGIRGAEDGLIEARTYVALFQRYYTLVIILMIVLALGIIIIVRNIKDIVHRLGIPLVTYGAIEYAAVLVTKYLISSGRIQFPEISPQLDAWLLQLTYDAMRPLEIFSLALLATGVVLIILSFLYKPKQDLTWS